MGRFLRRMLLRMMLPMSQWWASKTASDPKYEIDFWMRLIGVIRAGDIILTRKNGLMTNLFIPGKFKHAAMFVGKIGCVESVYPKIRQISIVSLLAKSDEIVIVRPRNMTLECANKAASEMIDLIDQPYDLLFEPGEKAFYCSEAIAYAYSKACEDFSFTTRSILGVDTVIPDDFRSDSHFKTIIES